ncbi:CPBP family intramembrane glutamic endopeptidase [Yoonia maritima]|uniref:CPBP family intramembrane glutamic endopeptidase n=1 Tax=Yoonia maritima TaxID=1435347 RepID=UPI0037358963
MNSLCRALWAFAIYFGILVGATASTFLSPNAPTDTVSIMWRLLPVKLVLLAFCYFYVTRYADWRSIGFGPVHWPGLIWLLPSCLLMCVMGIVTVLGTTTGEAVTINLPSFLLLITIPLFIGLTEEIMFRGILLRAFLERLPVFYAMLLSAILFGAMHLANGLTGQPMLATLQQVAFAFLVGVFLAPIALKTGNLWVVIIWHAVWDFLVYLSQLVGVLHHYALIGIMVQTLISVWLWAQLVQVKD